MFLSFLFSSAVAQKTSLFSSCKENGKTFEISLDWLETFGFNSGVKYQRFLGRSSSYFTEMGKNGQKDEYFFLDQSLRGSSGGVKNKSLMKYRVEIVEKLFSPKEDVFKVSCYSKSRRGYLLFTTRGKTQRVSKRKFVTFPILERLSFYGGVTKFLSRTLKTGAIFADFRLKDFFLMNGELQYPILPRFHSLYKLRGVARLDLGHDKYLPIKSKLLKEKYPKASPTSQGYLDIAVEPFWNTLNVMTLIRETEKLVKDKVDAKAESTRQKLAQLFEKYPLENFNDLPSLDQLQKELSEITKDSQRIASKKTLTASPQNTFTPSSQKTLTASPQKTFRSSSQKTLTVSPLKTTTPSSK